MLTKITRNFAVLILGLSLSATAWSMPHPMDPLSADEYQKIKAVLKAAGHVDDNTRYPLITLLEPSKKEVLGWQPGDDFSRRARLVVRQGPRVFTAAVDINAEKVLSWQEKPGVQSSVMFEEWAEVQQIALDNAEVQERLRSRGVVDLEKIYCPPASQGYFGGAEEEGRRLFKVYCIDLRVAGNNYYGYPIEGLYAVVDLRDKRVIQVHDSGVIPITTENLNFTENDIGVLRPPLKPVLNSQPNGLNFRLDGHVVEWQKWRFHLRMDRRLGVVLSKVTYRDQGEDRSVLYQGYMSEMFVPYNDPDFGWFSRTYFDVGEYGLGLLASPLVAGADCPHSAAFLPTVINDDEGGALEVPNTICIFERNTGNPLWRHAELLNETYEGRPAVELVVRMAPQIGNYDYLIDWVFKQNGELDGRVGATGIDALKGVKAKHMREPGAAAEAKYGMLVAPNIVAINHDHHFNYRLDLDVDGTSNHIIRNYYELEQLPSNHPRNYVYVVREESPYREATAQYRMGGQIQRFRVASSDKTNRVGNPTSYEILLPGRAAYILPQNEWYSQRANFLLNDLWITHHHAEERYGGGDFVFASKGDDGLQVWTRQNRPVKNKDLVAWINIGMNHFTRSEDMPVMPTLWRTFTLRPFNFFDHNPGLDVPTNFAE